MTLALAGPAHPEAPSSSGPDTSPKSQKVYKACQQFEALLISNLWNEMESSVGAMDLGSDPGAGTMQGLGIQAAAMGLASSGGLGIANMLYHSLTGKSAPSR